MTIPYLIDYSKSCYQLGVASMDDTHREFLDLVNKLAKAEKEPFILLFKLLVEHTEAHFSSELSLMEEFNFPATQIHDNEHQRVLEELKSVENQVVVGSITLGRTYVTEDLQNWFDHHTMTMDTALAAHIRSQRIMPR